jgi:hypothetical protein
MAALLFGRAADDQTGTAPVAAVTIVDEPDGIVRVTCNGELLHLGVDVGDAAAKLQEAMTAALAGANSSALVFHAAAVMRDGAAVILPGRSGSGKTTLSACLEKRGAVCLSDETCCVHPDPCRVEGLWRPFNVKTHGVSAFERLAGGVSGDDRDSVAGPMGTLVSLHRPGMELPARHSLPSLKAVVFPRYVAGSGVTWTRISPAAAALQLMGSLLNARNLDGHGFSAVTDLARDVSAYMIEYGDANEAAAQTEECFVRTR